MTLNTLNIFIATFGKRIVGIKINDGHMLVVNYPDSVKIAECRTVTKNGGEFLVVPRKDGYGNSYESWIDISQIQAIVIAETETGYVDKMLLF